MTGTVERTHDAVAVYVAQVRERLTGLSEDEVAELTDGLTGDLSDALRDADLGAAAAEEQDLVRRFGTPTAYADELCTAAGLVRDVPGADGAGWWASTVGRGRSLVAWFRTALARPGVAELAPVWWVLRGWVLYHLVLWALYSSAINPVHRDVLPKSGPAWLALLAFVVGSVWLGRAARRRRADAGGTVLVRAQRVVTAVAVVVAGPVMITVSTAHDELVWAYEGWDRSSEAGVSTGYSVFPDGIYVDGEQVFNLFLYDAQGEPLQDVQIYDSDGRPVSLVSDVPSRGMDMSVPQSGDAEEWFLSPATDVDGRARWNVYPLFGAPSSAYDWDAYLLDGDVELELLEGEELRRPPAPFAKAPALVGAESDTAASTGVGTAQDADDSDPDGATG